MCTNAVLCLPRCDGRRYPVTRALRDACRPWLERLIALLDPRVVVTSARNLSPPSDASRATGSR